MRHTLTLPKAFVVATAFVLTASSSAVAGGGGFEINWYTIDGGGGTSTGSTFELSGTIGQPDAGGLEGGSYALAGGFWAGGPAVVTCQEDLDGNGSVDFDDLLAVLAAWDNAGGPEDLDGSGTVDFGDLLLVLAAWGVCL